jgi:hypothetical protein
MAAAPHALTAEQLAAVNAAAPTTAPRGRAGLPARSQVRVGPDTSSGNELLHDSTLGRRQDRKAGRLPLRGAQVPPTALGAGSSALLGPRRHTRSSEEPGGRCGSPCRCASLHSRSVGSLLR